MDVILKARKHGICNVEFCDDAAFQRVMEGMPHDKEFEVIIRKERKRRSNEENRYYWGVVIAMIANDTGNDPEDIHEALKKKFLPSHTIKMGPIEEVISRSTTDLSTVEMEEYLSKIRAWAGNPDNGINCFIPLPNEVT